MLLAIIRCSDVGTRRIFQFNGLQHRAGRAPGRRAEFLEIAELVQVIVNRLLLVHFPEQLPAGDDVI
ncbi:hypothetical protein D3C85_1804060 [compost metagenome]